MRASASALCWSTRSPPFRCRRFTPTSRSARLYGSAPPSTMRRSMPRSKGWAARSRGPRDFVSRGPLLLAFHHRTHQQRGGGAEKQRDEDEQPARRLGEGCRPFFLRLVTDHEELVL